MPARLGTHGGGFGTLAMVALLFIASLAVSRSTGPVLALGPLAQHMLDHIVLLGLAAPVAAWTLRGRLPRVSGAVLAALAATQIVLIWAWHLPPVFSAAQGNTLAHWVMTTSLFATGFLFWGAIAGLADRDRWQAILALLLTGKLFCLFAAVLVFSPRLLYELNTGHAGHIGHGGPTELADQQLAGLIMIAVCPLTYVAAGIAMAARWLSAIDGGKKETSPHAHHLLVVPLLFILSGCSEVQSTLAPASFEASDVLRLSWVLFFGGMAIFALVMCLLALAMLGGDRLRAAIAAPRSIVIGGIAFPVVVLSILLAYGLWFATASAAPSKDEQKIALQGERWWWRVTYTDPKAKALASANEIRIEVGRPVRIALTSADVIHSFWVPALAGKVDLIPGRTNEIAFTPRKVGTFRGQCAEYCGGPHAMMALRVVVMEAGDYAAWMDRERRPADAHVAGQEGARGRDLFMTSCVACHAVRGTAAAGRLGPDLTHVASREAIAGEVLPMSKANLARWLTDNSSLKPNNLMPDYDHLAKTEIDALSSYLIDLR